VGNRSERSLGIAAVNGSAAFAVNGPDEYSTKDHNDSTNTLTTHSSSGSFSNLESVCPTLGTADNSRSTAAAAFPEGDGASRESGPNTGVAASNSSVCDTDSVLTMSTASTTSRITVNGALSGTRKKKAHGTMTLEDYTYIHSSIYVLS
jgi:hypothetical protein